MSEDDYEIEDSVFSDDLGDLLLRWSDGLEDIEHAVEAALAEVADGGLVEIGGARLLGGSDNGCPVDRLVRVELVGAGDSLLAEPSVRAVAECVLSLIRAK